VTHTLAVFSNPEPPGPPCSTAPRASTVLPIGSAVRRAVILGGTAASSTLGLYIYKEPTYPFPPSGSAVIPHNAAPAFSAGKPFGVGLGMCTTTVTPCATAVTLIASQGLPPATVSGSSAVLNGTFYLGLTSIPAGFYDGIGVPAGTVVPLTSTTAPAPIPFQAYIAQLYAVDGPAGGLSLIRLLETTQGFTF